MRRIINQGGFDNLLIHTYFTRFLLKKSVRTVNFKLLSYG